ncbi:hypothetical protein [Paenibacillus lemnae]|uniref:Uncharacterized protein n=1 Tax=Paenibacillus lemnae TaxID=1330551 RepID=A0A848M1A3_PAELE|nr:hypothetical protein [Paenibacillus lemnae]NMO94637.1 hypothetical protein [Paenibacillus lemnae]
MMSRLEHWLSQESHNYMLIAAAAILFFAVKAVIGYYTFRHYNRQLKELQAKIELLLQQEQHNTSK